MSFTNAQASDIDLKRTASLRLYSLPNTEEIQACWELCRLHNNIGFWVIWLPTAWSIAMYYRANLNVSGLSCLQVAFFFVPLCLGIKSLIMTIDDILDRDVDLLVERTMNRPLPRGAISVHRAWLFFAIQVVTGLYLAVFHLKPETRYISMAAWPIFLVYPTCKGFMFAPGIFMGWSQLDPNGDVAWKILIPVYLGCVCWTIAYETVYQHQDKVDDKKIGLHSPALYCAEKTIPICICSSVCFFALLVYGGAMNEHGIAFHSAVLVASRLHFSQLVKTNIDIPETCKQFFLAAPRVGQIILTGLVIDGVLSRLVMGLPL
ncbi:hypothetical protein H2248_012489 [Termitomyces sp. 'cryptogamus']|nr:hypothetical protein H2248_012489 [Termitomyces sp. 'cryptogamus']